MRASGKLFISLRSHIFQLTNNPQIVDVYAAIVDPKHANTLVRKLNQIAPLENLRHVKRVRKHFLEGGKSQLSVILCLACGNGSLLDGIPNGVLELINLYQLSAFITKVCRYAALSKEEWEEQCKLWPTSFHPPTYNIDGITGFSVEDSHSIVNFMNLAVHMAKSGDGQLVNAAIIVDPSTKELIARACDQTHIPQPMIGQTGAETCFLKEQEAYTSDPLAGREENHEILLPNSSLDEPRQLYTGVACLSPRRWAEKQLHTCIRHPLGHAAIVAIEHSAARDRRLFPAIGHAGGDSAQIDHTVSSLTASPAKRQRTNLKDVEDGEKVHSHTNGFHSELVRPYLCTGYDIFLVWEPCTMCSMALVHQRIRRIFYAFPNPNEGALGSVHRLQGEKSLNHHYAVFRVVLPAKILEAGGSIVSNSCEDDNKTT
ncbi:tRNA-specific adenosine deaminase TAD3 isoform X2 [Diospyros lotus]|uniref:tRNA-specific adenosine deaminase TAD3 isoform X2 n=1 Tax=Diospyros lotus TaxID=55363 RepID=UPI0022551293|nr:tRNA-specific adenosine deaminase TAD3 isoform X2 [Diospyros lotus]